MRRFDWMRVWVLAAVLMAWPVAACDGDDGDEGDDTAVGGDTTGGGDTAVTGDSTVTGDTSVAGDTTGGGDKIGWPGWDNATVYFVITDRFFDGNTANNNSYGREPDGQGEWATFQGGDLAGLTQKLDEGYFEDLGVSAIW